jgi:peptide chain release factor 1
LFIYKREFIINRMANINVEKYRQEYDELATRLADPSKVDSRELGKLFSRQSALQEILDLADEITKLENSISMDNELLESGESDQDFVELIKNELLELEQRKQSLISQLEILIIPPDPNDDKNSIVEIRAGTGGEEAGIFAQDLFRMYTRYAALKNWQLQLISMSESDHGIKEVIFKLSGKSIYKVLKYESGVHRVQRVPETEAAGRIHTSAASVVVMPEIDDIDIQINQNDLVIDVYRSSGHGGQSVNTTDSAVRITHIPSGLVVTCQDTKDQQKNKASAMAVLRSRLYQIELDKQMSEVGDIRKSSIKTGDRSDKIKTYNFPQDRLTDHRIHKSWFGLDRFMNGEIEDILKETIVELEKQKTAVLE